MLTIELHLPSWLPAAENRYVPSADIEARMRFVIELSRTNINNASGGPFAAAVFETESGKLIGAGVNVVVSQNCSLAHAEAMALMRAQKILSTFDLAAAHLPSLQLVTSSQPCIQCFGNTWWSGVRSLVFGARAEDVERITGLCEGPIPANWKSLLSERPTPLPAIDVVSDVLRESAAAVLQEYKDSGARIYNSGSS